MAVLIVDNEPSDLQLLVRAFSTVSPDRRVIACSSAAEALELLSVATTERVSELLVVTDLKMPGMDGKELIAAIRQGWMPGPVVIALSTSSYQRDIDEAFAAGANAYHEKPMGYHGTVELCEKVTSYWDSVSQPATTKRTEVPQ